jgi:hypothetical protein
MPLFEELGRSNGSSGEAVTIVGGQTKTPLGPIGQTVTCAQLIEAIAKDSELIARAKIVTLDPLWLEGRDRKLCTVTCISSIKSPRIPPQVSLAG